MRLADRVSALNLFIHKPYDTTDTYSIYFSLRPRYNYNLSQNVIPFHEYNFLTHWTHWILLFQRLSTEEQAVLFNKMRI